jgi:hypothetical protein
VNYYLSDQLDPEELEALRALVLVDLAQAGKQAESKRKRLIAQVTEVPQTRSHRWRTTRLQPTSRRRPTNEAQAIKEGSSHPTFAPFVSISRRYRVGCLMTICSG